MKKLITVFFSLAISITLNAQSIYDDFESYTDTSNLKATWKGFGNALNGQYSLTETNGKNNSKAAEYKVDWTAGTFFGAQLVVGSTAGEDYSDALKVSVDVKFENETIEGLNDTATDTTFKFQMRDMNNTVYQTNYSPITSSFTNFEFEINNENMSFSEGTESITLEQVASNLQDFRFIVLNDDGAGVQNIYFDNFNVSSVPEPSVYALLAGLLSLGWISIKRRIR